MTDEEPLDTEMSAERGNPEAVAKVFRASAEMLEQMPDDMVLSFELSLWEETE